MWLLALALGCGSAAACAWPLPREAPVEAEQPEAVVLAPHSRLRRMSAYEYDNVLADLLDDDARAAALLLPADGRTPFDNDADEQTVSAALVEAAELLAREAAARLLADRSRRDRVIGCTPQESSDCFSDFVMRFGRRALRGPLSSDEAAPFIALQDSLSFEHAVEVAIVAFLQHPRFIYRVEIGEDMGDGTFRLHGHEIATRLSFLLWGTTPDDELLDAAAGGELDDAAGIERHAERLLAGERARRQVARIFAMWMGSELLPHAPTLATAMRRETDAVIERVVFDEQRPWRDVFTDSETFVTPALASHYGWDPVPSPSWVSPKEHDRAGVLSHGAFLSLGAKLGDTSPTLRGLAVRQRLLCEAIGSPPPGVAVDDPIEAPQGIVCKEQLYRTVHASGGCADCHRMIDDIGFGLERYDAAGRFRSHEAEPPQCAIRGDGEVVGLGAFHGPAELGALLAGSERLGVCFVEQLVRYALGRATLTKADRALVDAVAKAGAGPEARLVDVLLELVTHPAFALRRDEEAA